MILIYDKFKLNAYDWVDNFSFKKSIYEDARKWSLSCSVCLGLMGNLMHPKDWSVHFPSPEDFISERMAK